MTRLVIENSAIILKVLEKSTLWIQNNRLIKLQNCVNMIIQKFTTREIHHLPHGFGDTAVDHSEARDNEFSQHYRTRAPDSGSNKQTFEISTCTGVFSPAFNPASGESRASTST